MINSYTHIQHRAEGGFCKHACLCISEPWEYLYHVFQHPLRLLLLLLLFVITLMQGIYNYIPETDHVYRVYAIVLQLFCSYSSWYM
jgi:hypothetical protein